MMLAACALACPGVASAQDFPSSTVGLEVRADDGQPLGEVRQITRDRHGRIISARLPNEPADAPAAAPALVADAQPRERITARYRSGEAEARPRRGAGGGDRSLR